jgi:hypothetical protein
MLSPFRPIRQRTFMCTVQACPHVAAFVFTGGINCATGGRSSVAEYCDHHAEEAAAQLGHLLADSGVPTAKRRGARSFFRTG